MQWLGFGRGFVYDENSLTTTTIDNAERKRVPKGQPGGGQFVSGSSKEYKASQKIAADLLDESHPEYAEVAEHLRSGTPLKDLHTRHDVAEAADILEKRGFANQAIHLKALHGPLTPSKWTPPGWEQHGGVGPHRDGEESDITPNQRVAHERIAKVTGTGGAHTFRHPPTLLRGRNIRGEVVPDDDIQMEFDVAGNTGSADKKAEIIEKIAREHGGGVMLRLVRKNIIIHLPREINHG